MFPIFSTTLPGFVDETEIDMGPICWSQPTVSTTQPNQTQLFHSKTRPNPTQASRTGTECSTIEQFYVRNIEVIQMYSMHSKSKTELLSSKLLQTPHVIASLRIKMCRLSTAFIVDLLKKNKICDLDPTQPMDGPDHVHLLVYYNYRCSGMQRCRVCSCAVLQLTYLLFVNKRPRTLESFRIF